MTDIKYAAGIDAGSRTTKIVLLDARDARILKREIINTGIDPQGKTQQLLQEALASTGIADLSMIATTTTGYGRKSVLSGTPARSEILCHARGVHRQFPEVRTVIDLGGQDAKVIRLDETGTVVDFVMNDKCAAGTGRFMERVAELLETRIDHLGEQDRKSLQESKLTSTCVVFAESEIIGLIASGGTVPDIVRAVHRSLARRLFSLGSPLGWLQPVALTGGGALNAGLVRALEDQLGFSLRIPDHPVFTGAEGAALFALNK